MRVMLVLSDSHKIFLNSFLEAFKSLEMESSYFFVDDEKKYKPQREKLLAKIATEKPEKILQLNDLNNGEEFFLNETILNKVNCYLWFVDTMTRCKIRDPHMNAYAAVFSFEPKDVQFCATTYNRVMQYVPLTAGTGLFCSNPDSCKTKEYDVSFVGLVAGLKKRLEVLEAVAKYCKQHNKKMVTYGHFWHNSHPLQKIVGGIKFRFKHPELATVVKNVNLAPQEAANLYLHTKINLNIHHVNHTGRVST